MPPPPSASSSQARRRSAPAKGSSATAGRPAEMPAAPASPPEPPPAPKETLSLIDDEPKPKKDRATGAARGTKTSGLPPISKIRTPAARAASLAAAVQAAKAAVVVPPPPPKPEVVDLISGSAPRKREEVEAAAPEPVVVAEAAPEAAAEPTEVAQDTPEAAAEPSEEKIIHLKPPIIVKDLAPLMNLRPFQLIKDLIGLNIFASINQTIEPEVATKVCALHGFTFEVERREKGGGVHKVEQKVEAPPAPVEIKEDELQLRAPIITFMGHVDHGKTSLMDAVRKTRVAAGEAGGITQHIGAYRVEWNGRPITFLDTPGHAAFTAMRARGANLTDIVVLVVAADDGLMPQTLEAISHARAAKVKIVVAINKIDLPSANVDKVKGQLQAQGLAPDDWGGETVCCPVSATKGTGVDHLLEMLALESELLELKSNPSANMRGTVVESQIEAGRGPTATIIVRMGTLRSGDAFICGQHWGKVKAMFDDRNKPVREAGPSMPVKVLGFTGLPSAGDELVVMESDRDARTLSEERVEAQRSQKLAPPPRPSLESFYAQLNADDKKFLRVVLKTDVQGSMEALVGALKEIKSKKIELEFVHNGVGPVTENDVLLASASNAVILGFGVKVENVALSTAKREGVQIKLFSIIYELIDQVRDAMTGLLDPETRENVIGHAEVRQVFDLTKGIVAGCYVTDGRVLRSARARVLRRRQSVYDGGVATLRRFTDDVKEVRSGFECGIKLGDYEEYEAGDIIEFYTLEKFAQTL